MSVTAMATLALVGVALVGQFGATLLLAYRIGRLTGSTDARMQGADDDRSRIWQAIGALTSKIDRHIETKHAQGG